MIYRLYYRKNERTIFIKNMVFTDRREAELWVIRWNALDSSLGTVRIHEEKA